MFGCKTQNNKKRKKANEKIKRNVDDDDYDALHHVKEDHYL